MVKCLMIRVLHFKFFHSGIDISTFENFDHPQIVDNVVSAVIMQKRARLKQRCRLKPARFGGHFI